MEFKRGDTLGFTVELLEGDQPLVIDPANIKCQIRTKNDQLIEELLITAGSVEGEYNFRSKGTEKYPIGTLELDIQIKRGEQISSTETFFLTIVKDITRTLEKEG